MLPNWYLDYKKLIDNSVEEYLTEYFKSEKNPWLNTIKESSIYACKWWKRIRSILALEFYLIFTKNPLSKSFPQREKDFNKLSINDDIIKFCIALELLHAYSLVHDDLPAMDNDEYRRGELTTWKKYWETNAILVWDLLNSLAFEILAEIWISKLSKLFWKAVWINWMLGWQVLDIFYEKNPEKLNLENLIETHNKKTWALIEVSILWWLILAEDKVDFVKDEETNDIKKYLDFWKKIGLAFQVKDDLLDVEWTLEETGKSVWDWEEKGFVYFLGLEETHKYLDNLILDCKNIISELNSEKLNFLVEYIGNRKK